MKDKIFSKFYLAREEKELLCERPKKAYLQYQNYRINLLNNKREEIGVDSFLNDLFLIKVQEESESPLVIHLFFELGYLLEKVSQVINEPLALYIDYTQAKIQEVAAPSKKLDMTLKLKNSLSFKAYEKAFDKVYNHLILGNCYQVNLTSEFIFKHSMKVEEIDEIFSAYWKSKDKIGAYAHGTFVPSMQTLFLSNSPECLFQIGPKASYIRTMPIKGTVSLKDGSDFKMKWRLLKKCQKNEGELNMITDLLRNDLTRVEMNPAKVLYKKWPLKVPGLLHQMSVLESNITGHLSLKTVVESLFPGGSITGAPKTRVLEIIKEVESSARGYYCGSTILFYKHIKTASINIRSSKINFESDELSYGAGGGITLLSSSKEEYEESMSKLKSFLLITK